MKSVAVRMATVLIISFRGILDALIRPMAV